MREMIVPKDVELVDPFTGEPALDEKKERVTYPMARVLKAAVATPAFANGVAAIVSGIAILAAWEKRENGHWTLAEEDWAKLKSWLEKPTYEAMGQMGPQKVEGFPFATGFLSQLMPYFTSILDAKQV